MEEKVLRKEENAANERTIQAAEINLIRFNKLSNENVGALIDAYIYDAAAPIRALISFLKKMKVIIQSGKVVECNIKGETYTIKTEKEFYEFVKKYFEDISVDV